MLAVLYIFFIAFFFFFLMKTRNFQQSYIREKKQNKQSHYKFQLALKKILQIHHTHTYQPFFNGPTFHYPREKKKRKKELFFFLVILHSHNYGCNKRKTSMNLWISFLFFPPWLDHGVTSTCLSKFLSS